jgi:polysaccharide deacetylase family protein (PEP-CTERM system associated)
MSRKIHCLSFDIEEHFQVSAFDSPMRRRHWEQFESRVVRNTHKVLELLAMHDARATFFILGWVAERHPDLVRDLARDGHEIASHGYAHEMIMNQTPEQFREDVRKAKVILEDIIGKPVLGYRAPSFTITPETAWTLRVLVEEGYLYDSSIVPIFHDRYGFPGSDPRPHRLATTAGSLWEVPPSTASVFGLRLPAAGGGYLRVYPFAFFRWLLKRAEAQGHPLVLYCHPWELDPEQPRMNGSWVSQFRHYINLHKTKDRLTMLLAEFAFAPIREGVEAISQLSQQQGKRPRSTREHALSSSQAGHVIRR